MILRHFIGALALSLLAVGPGQAEMLPEMPFAAPDEARVAQLTQALVAGELSATYDMTSSFLARKVSLYALQGMLQTGGIYGEAGQFQFTEALQEVVEGSTEVTLIGQFHPEDGAPARPVRLSWLQEDGEWRLNRFGFDS